MTIRYFKSRPDGDVVAQELSRRGILLGYIEVAGKPAMPDADSIGTAWQDHRATYLPGILADVLPRYRAELDQSHALMTQTRDGALLSELLEEAAYDARLQPEFELTASSFEEHDDQGIEKVYFDAWQHDEAVADNLWCKASWLSFDDEDGSLRFRFSFGLEGYEDVAADPERQAWAAKLTDAVFPESAAVTEHEGLNRLLTQMLGCERIAYAERIVYFNAPNGGAQMHHDVERGHDGVVFAQMTGSTFWLALSKPTLMDEIEAYLAAASADEWSGLRALSQDRESFSAYLEENDHELAEALMDRTPDFFRHLIERGYAHVLEPGDVLLLPQASLETCVWHSVLCLGEETGEGLSFALRKA